MQEQYGIIKDHDGELTAFNNESGGATFLIKLPVAGGDYMSKSEGLAPVETLVETPFGESG